MELPRRTQGNPDGGLWAADEAHFVQRPEGGGGGECRRARGKRSRIGGFCRDRNKRSLSDKKREW